MGILDTVIDEAHGDAQTPEPATTWRDHFNRSNQITGFAKPPCLVKFLNDEPTCYMHPKFHREAYVWDVELFDSDSDRWLKGNLDTTSVRLLKCLSNQKELARGYYILIRAGLGFETKYEANWYDSEEKAIQVWKLFRDTKKKELV